MTKDARHYDLIVSPVITEKATMASEQDKVVFKVRRDATKPQIKAAVEALFDVKVEKVNTLLTKGKVKRFKGFLGKRSDVKKAVVTLADGQSIDISAGV
jgi:large subunit ribosomal protein L23